MVETEETNIDCIFSILSPEMSNIRLLPISAQKKSHQAEK